LATKPKIEVQSVRFSKEFFSDYDTCVKWLVGKDYSSRLFKEVDDFYAFDQLSSDRFIETSLQLFKLGGGIEVLAGIVKEDAELNLDNIYDTAEPDINGESSELQLMKEKYNKAISQLETILTTLKESAFEQVSKDVTPKFVGDGDIEDCDIELFVPLIKSKEERIVFGEVLIPNETDAHRDIYSEEDVLKAAHIWMRDFGSTMGYMHKQERDDVLVLESYVAPQAFKIESSDGSSRKIKKGTWLLKVYVESDELWEKVKDGDITGFSIGGSANVEEIK